MALAQYNVKINLNVCKTSICVTLLPIFTPKYQLKPLLAGVPRTQAIITRVQIHGYTL